MHRLIFAVVLLATGHSSSAASFVGEVAADPIRFFSGHTHSWGVFEDRAGNPTRLIHTETWGYPEGRRGEGLRIEQDLLIEKMPRSHRTLHLRKIDRFHYTLTGNGLIGTARGEVEGSYCRLDEKLALKPGNLLFNVRMTQNLYFMADGQTMVNRDTVRKFGFIVAEITEHFVRVH